MKMGGWFLAIGLCASFAQAPIFAADPPKPALNPAPTAKD